MLEGGGQGDVPKEEPKEVRCVCGHLLFKIEDGFIEIKHRNCPWVTIVDPQTGEKLGEERVVRLRGAG